MAAWLIPALKAVLPHIGIILSAAVPVFTKKNTDAANQTLVQQQIAELQSAAFQNATHIKELAAQLQTAVAALEQTLTLVETKYQRARWAAGAAILMSFLAIGVALLLVFLRV